MKTSELAIAILAVVAVVVVVFSIVMLADLVATPEKATTSYSTTTTSCETDTFKAYGRLVSPIDSIDLWSLDLTWMETGTARLYIRADVSSDVPVALVVGGRDIRSDQTEIVFSTKPSTRIVGYYSVDLYKGQYAVLLINPNDVRAIINGEIEVTLCTKVPILTTSRSDVTVLKTLAVVLAVLASALIVVLGLFLWFLWYTKRRASATTGTSTS